MRMAARFLALTLTASAAAAGAACAQDAPVQTAPAAAPASPTDAPAPAPPKAAAPSSAPAPAATNAPAAASASSGGSDLDRWLKQAPPVATLGDDYASGVIAGPAPDRSIHGEVGVSVGSGGYTDVYAAATMPVGKSGQLGVAVEDTQFSKPFKVNARRLDVNLALGGGGAAPPADCEDALRVGDRFVEPLWVTRMRGSALEDVDPRCVSADPGPPPR